MHILTGHSSHGPEYKSLERIVWQLSQVEMEVDSRAEMAMKMRLRRPRLGAFVTQSRYCDISTEEKET